MASKIWSLGEKWRMMEGGRWTMSVKQNVGLQWHQYLMLELETSTEASMINKFNFGFEFFIISTRVLIEM